MNGRRRRGRNGSKARLGVWDYNPLNSDSQPTAALIKCFQSAISEVIGLFGVITIQVRRIHVKRYSAHSLRYIVVLRLYLQSCWDWVMPAACPQKRLRILPILPIVSSRGPNQLSSIEMVKPTTCFKPPKLEPNSNHSLHFHVCLANK